MLCLQWFHIRQAMQQIIELSSLQEATCKALCAIIEGSEVYKNIALSLGIIDATICLILVHPHDVNVINEAVKVLLSMSDLNGCVEKIALGGAITAVIDAMHSNKTSVDLTISGARFIRNLVLAEEKLVNDTIESITVIISCMDEHPESAELLVEACDALKCLVTSSEVCKKHLLASHGRSILEKIITEKKYGDMEGSSLVTIAIHSLLDELC